jgi:hypothetical protein
LSDIVNFLKSLEFCRNIMYHMMQLKMRGFWAILYVCQCVNEAIIKCRWIKEATLRDCMYPPHSFDCRKRYIQPEIVFF